VSDFKGFDALVDDDLPVARVFLADRGYDSDHIRATITERGGTAVIPAKANRKEPIPPRQRHLRVEKPHREMLC